MVRAIMHPREEWTTKDIDEILDEFKVMTVPVSVSVEGRQRVLGYEESERLLKQARLISLEDCSCRMKIKGCDGPLDVCVCMDGEAEEAIEERGAHETTFEAAMDALRRSHEAGLVHLAYETKGRRIEIICSCCACCCHTLAAITRFGYDEAIIGHADVVATRDPRLCDGCGVCVTGCHFKAWFVKDGEIEHARGKCAGCGVCASSCPVGAITMVPRDPDG